MVFSLCTNFNNSTITFSKSYIRPNMGQRQSSNGGRYCASRELFSNELANLFAKRCFAPLELYSFQEVFKSLADHHDQGSFVKENKITQFLKIPNIIGVQPVIFQMLSYLGAFPFGQDAPAKLGFNQMIMVIIIMTGRYQRVMKDCHYRIKILFRSLAVYDRHDLPKPINVLDTEDVIRRTNKSSLSLQNQTSTVSNVVSGEENNESLASAALNLMGVTNVFQISETPLYQTSIPSDNFKKLILLLLFIAPLRIHEGLFINSDGLAGRRLEGLRRTADSILAAFINAEKFPGVRFHEFEMVISTSMPFIFNGLGPLFERFLYLDNINITKHFENSTASVESNILIDQPLLPSRGEILDMNVLAQLSLFLPRSLLLGRLRLLYSGGDAGFSMGSFETHVFNWRAPTILLVSGNRISEPPSNRQERAFTSTLFPKRFPNSCTSSHLVFGIYLSQYWRQTHKNCFGDADTLLFQLEPIHEVFHASSVNTEYISFSKSTSNQGISAGCPPPKPKSVSHLSNHVNFGVVSLFLDSSFEFGAFNHCYTSAGGAFHHSKTRRFDWQDRFEIESLEVWGCGGDNEAEKQKTMWQWEEREAEARRRVNLGSGDIQTDRALLEMAGLIGANMSGGSIY